MSRLEPRPRECSDCRGALEPVRLIDRGHNFRHYQAGYAAHDARRSFWTGQYPVEGQITGFMCTKCGRVVLYAVPAEKG